MGGGASLRATIIPDAGAGMRQRQAALLAVFVPQVFDAAWSMPRCVDIGIW